MGSTAEKIAKRFTSAEYCKWDDEQRWELIAGIPYKTTPAPTTRHQRISSNLHRKIAGGLSGT